MKCGYLGPKGSFSYLALVEAFPELTPVACDTFAEITEKVDAGILERAILPVENSTEGAVTSVMDNLLILNQASILAETVLTVTHHLYSVDPGIASIHTVFSHPQAIEQCRHFFRNHFPGIQLIPCESTSAACVLAKERGVGTGAITSKWAGTHNGLQLAARSIQDNRFNQTRFILLGIGHPPATGNDKTAIAFSFHRDYAGSLYLILKIFADQNINLTRIESRPAKMELGQYIFFIDFEGHQNDAAVKEVLEKIGLLTRNLFVFGSFAVTKNVANLN